MPRKQGTGFAFTAPSYGFTHNSLNRSGSGTDAAPAQASESSVNERLEYLRSVQSRPQLSITSDELLRSTHAPVRLKKRMAGPPPPRSWLENSRSPRQRFTDGSQETRIAHDIGYFPGIKVPENGSLTHLALKAITSNWDFQAAYQGDWLSTLPQHLKTLLLSYLARYGPTQGLSLDQLRKLMSSESDTGSSDSTGCQQVSRLDLARAFGRTINARSLRSFLLSEGGGVRTKHTTQAQKQPLNSWEDEDLPELSLASMQLNDSKPFYEHLTHLSLADPHTAGVSWPDFVDRLSPHLGNLTHLSLENWPSPSPTFAITDLSNGVNISEEDAKAQGRYRLQCLSQNTSSLEYLNLRGCADWLELFRSPAANTISAIPVRRVGASRVAAVYSFDDGPSNKGASTTNSSRSHSVDWSRTWGQVSELDIHDDWVPSPLDLSLNTLADTLHKRDGRAPHRADALRAQSEIVRVQTANGGYRELVPDLGHSHLISLGRPARNWLLREHEKLKLVRYIRRQRSNAGSGSGARSQWPSVRWGAEREALVQAGWDEGELFGVGL